MIPEFLKNRIELKFGKAIRYPKDCEALSIDINKVCDEKISATTLKRVFGLVETVKKPRLFTLDVLAQYAGFSSWDTAVHNIELHDGSSFEGDALLLTSTLDKGKEIKIAYSPDRELVVEYLQHNNFVVKNSSKSKLLPNDIIIVHRFEVGYPLVCEKVIRNSKELGKFIGGKEGGIVSFSILN